ncbi:bifunctional methionine sulfoxide reductase A/B [Streptococcus pyogenes]|nr:bifunctional methionine sulfoxide reductase A/B [Streptococcus pyogenes]
MIDESKYPKPSAAEIKAKLSADEYRVTQKNETEKAFSNRYWDSFDAGIYVDVVTGEPFSLQKTNLNQVVVGQVLAAPSAQMLFVTRKIRVSI